MFDSKYFFSVAVSQVDPTNQNNADQRIKTKKFLIVNLNKKNGSPKTPQTKKMFQGKTKRAPEKLRIVLLSYAQ